MFELKMSKEMFGNVLFIPPDVLFLVSDHQHTEVKIDSVCLFVYMYLDRIHPEVQKKNPKDFEFCATDVIFTLSPVAT